MPRGLCGGSARQLRVFEIKPRFSLSLYDRGVAGQQASLSENAAACILQTNSGYAATTYLTCRQFLAVSSPHLFGALLFL
jgi:hypothetical protein